MTKELSDVSRVEFFTNHHDDIRVYAYKIDTTTHSVVEFLESYKYNGFLYFCYKDDNAKDFKVVYKKCKLDEILLFNIHYEG